MAARNPDPAGTAAEGRTSLLLAAAGILLGTGMFLFGLGCPPGCGKQETNVVARVNGRPIAAERFYQLALGLNDERRAGGRPLLERSEVLERLIDEELFVDRAVALGLPYQDKIVRGYLINSLLAMITHEAMHESPPRQVLERFYEENLPWFTPARQAAVRLLFVADGGAEGRERLEAARRAWERQPPAEGSTLDPEPVPVPRTPVPVQKLAEYLGSEAAGRIARLALGETTPPMPWMDGWVAARCTWRSAEAPPGFEVVEAQVLEAWRRRRAEEDYRAYLKRLRLEADIHTCLEAP